MKVQPVSIQISYFFFQIREIVNFLEGKCLLQEILELSFSFCFPLSIDRHRRHSYVKVLLYDVALKCSSIPAVAVPNHYSGKKIGWY